MIAFDDEDCPLKDHLGLCEHCGKIVLIFEKNGVALIFDPTAFQRRVIRALIGMRAAANYGFGPNFGVLHRCEEPQATSKYAAQGLLSVDASHLAN